MVSLNKAIKKFCGKLSKKERQHEAVIIKVYRTDSNVCYGLKVKNHTLTDVCIIVSTLTINLVNSIELLTGESVTILEIDEEKGIIHFIIPELKHGKTNADVALLFDSYLLATDSLKANYPKYIKLLGSGRCNYVKS